MKRTLFLALCLFASPIFAEKAVKQQINCKDIQHYGSLNFNVKIWDESTVQVVMSGHFIGKIATALEMPNLETMNEIKFEIDRNACKFSTEHPDVFSCYFQNEEPLSLSAFDINNNFIGAFDVVEYKMALFSETRVGYPEHRSSLMERKGHQLQLSLKSSENFKIFYITHDYFYHGQPECTVIGN